MTLLAAIALLLAIACGVAGWLAFESEMTVNVVSGLMELFLGVSLAVFIIDRVNRIQAKREWAAAYIAINGLLAASFIDLMRLMVIRVANYYSDDEDRYNEFVQVASFHSAALRSAIEGFATALEPGSHQLMRSAELRLAWLTQKLSDRRWFCPAEEYLQRVHELADDIDKLFARQGDPRYTTAKVVSLDIVRGLIEEEGGRDGYVEAIGRRYVAQTQLLYNLGIAHASGRYIFDDMDNELAVAYFALDRELLAAGSRPRMI